MSLPRDLSQLQERIETLADDYGLETYQVVFEMVDYAEMNQLAAYTGFPVRYPHWRWGMEFDQLSKSYEYGLHKIYEMVINNDPTYAYLLEGNSFLDQKLVMAHVYGHADFFRKNVYFSHTNRKMVDQMANHATRIRRYRDRFGIDPVESFLDDCLAIEDLIDPHQAFEQHYGLDAHDAPDEQDLRTVRRLPAKDYMQPYVNPQEYIERQEKELAEERARERRFPPNPLRDVLGFLLKNAPLENWERDVLAIVREESYYFLPQRQTKIMNEGWACFWHTTLLSNHLLSSEEVVDYADHHSGTTAVAPGGLNPYKLGLELFRDIEQRWNAGRFGSEWNACDNMVERRRWDKKLGLGREKIFEVRRVHNDLSFLDEFLTEDFCREHRLFVYAKHRRKDAWAVASREFEQIKRALLFRLTNAGTPIIEVVDANFRNRGELLLTHEHDGVDLKLDWAKESLTAIQRLWRRPVHLETTIKGKSVRLSHDGESQSETTITAPASAQETAEATG